MESNDGTSIIVSSLWMVGLSLILFFLPALNGLIGGLVGGYKAGSVNRALTASALPAIAVGLLLWLLLALLDMPIIGFFSGIAVGIWALFSSIALVIGALIGGGVSQATR